MSNRPRRKAETLDPVTSITPEEHNRIRTSGAADPTFWNTKGIDAGLVQAFRSEAKRHYWLRQARRCCYCSKELDEHRGAYDAEHILAEVSFPEFMFEVDNLCSACKTCNSVKGKKSVLSLANAPESVPQDSDAYVIVHPHLDEWSDHLYFDKVERIVAIDRSTKGARTIDICGIKHLNSARLADHFLPGDNNAAQHALERFFSVKSKAWKRKYVEMLRIMANEFDLAPARAIVDILEEEIESGTTDVKVVAEAQVALA